MSRAFRVAVWTIWLGLGLVARAAEPPDFGPVRSFIAERLAKQDAPSVAVAVARKDRTILAEGFGLADVEAKRPATPDTIYRLASVSKPITATGLMILVDRGRIDLDAPANRYLEGSPLRAFAGKAEELTVRRIANHTSGLPVYHNFFYDHIKPTPIPETIRRYGFAVAEPGTRWAYSNLGFGILGHIVERVAGTPWRDFNEHELFDPIGMSRTSDRIRPGHEADAAVPCTRDVAGRFLPVADYDFDHPGASAICSSANDLVRFARLHLNDGILDGVRIISAESARAMRKLTGVRSEGQGTGIGWGVGKDHGRACVSHTGGMPGVATALRIYPEDDLAIVVLTNGESSSLVAKVADRIAEILLPKREKTEDRKGDRPKDKGPESAGSDVESGTWTGRLVHFGGDVPIHLDLDASKKSARVRLGEGSALDLADVSIRDGKLGGSVVGELRTRPGFHGTPVLAFDLKREGDRLRGIVAAQADGYFNLPHWVELTREAPKEKTSEKRADAKGEPFDLLIKGGRIIDGCGTPWYRGDLAIRGDRIAALGRLGDVRARRTIDASGLVIAPGFIDLMGQTASPFLDDPRAGDNLLTQGITTINAGEGDSAAPLAEAAAARAGWRTMAEYFERLERAGLPLNVVQTVGHTQVRRLVLGDVDRRATPEELRRMEDLVAEAMAAGAVGVSSALIYPPAVYAPTEELIALAKVAGRYHGRYFTHMRNEGDRLLEAIDEALAIGRAAGTPVHIFHLKAAGMANWPKMDEAIARIKAARASGLEVGADVYPYVNNGLDLISFIHPRHAADGAEALRERLDDPAVRAEIRRELESGTGWENWYRHIGNDWENVVVAGLEDAPYAGHNGESLAAMAKAVGKDPWDVFFEASRRGAFALPRSMSEAVLIRAMTQDFISFDTDVGPAGGSAIASHPRAFGSFPRVLGRFARDLGVLTLEGAVRRMSAGAANELGLHDRGRLATGLAADIVVFDPEHVRDRATLDRPNVPSEGTRHVLVNGKLVIEDGRPTAEKPGRVLRGPGFRPPRP